MRAPHPARPAPPRAQVIVASGGVGGGPRPFGPEPEPSLYLSLCKAAGVAGAILGYLWRVVVVVATGVARIVEGVSSL